jgi:hypothetical protein
MIVSPALQMTVTSAVAVVFTTVQIRREHNGRPPRRPPLFGIRRETWRWIFLAALVLGLLQLAVLPGPNVRW